MSPDCDNAGHCFSASVLSSRLDRRFSFSDSFYDTFGSNGRNLSVTGRPLDGFVISC